MTRVQFLAAEIFAYSFANYPDHLGIGNLRFEKFMPDTPKTLGRTTQEGWSDERLAKAIEVEPSAAPEWRTHLIAIETNPRTHGVLHRRTGQSGMDLDLRSRAAEKPDLPTPLSLWAILIGRQLSSLRNQPPVGLAA